MKRGPRPMPLHLRLITDRSRGLPPDAQTARPPAAARCWHPISLIAKRVESGNAWRQYYSNSAC